MLAFVLYYSFGYKYNLENGTTVQTGIIVMKTTPKDVTIYNNGQILENNKSITSFLSNIIKIENLNKGKYNIKIEKDDYHSWEKNIEVKEGLATSFVNIVLLKKDYDKKIILDKVEKNLNLKSFWENNQRNKVIYKKGKDLNIFDIKNNNEITISIAKSGIPKNFDIKNVIWSNDGTKLIIGISIAKNSNWYLIDLENENKLSNLDNAFSNNKELRNKSNINLDEFLYYTNKNNLYKLDYKTLSSEKILSNVSSFLIQDKNVYYFSKNDNSLYSANINDFSKVKTVTTMPDDFNNLLDAKITRSKEKIFTILSSSGNLYFINKNNEVTFVNSFVEKAKFSDNSNKIVYNNEHEIWIYYVNQDASQTPEKEFANNLITRFSGIINNVYLYKDNEHLLYQEGNTIKFLELDDRDRRNVFALIEINNNNIFYAKNSNSLFYIEDKKLLQIDLNEE
ncbi:MAG: hypothetical protein KAI57_04135 [Candidatus Pacebacteria bacterium]|nr:hypothetical protein [Candidatus Paceibacterota bacterium]